ncbi:MAG: type II toxin-antitoxin system PemK/MazF family toxin [Clostridia bacterium]|nr:type II toxin-antitoxin system PemK/MazF family toxin [Clostridia bacterium]
MEETKKKRKLTKDDVQIHKDNTLNLLNTYMDDLIKNPETLKKADLLSFWFEDFINYIQHEDDFNCSLLKEYSRGDIIKANLGFNVGNEEGGLHYCVVLDKKNAKAHSTLTVVPLTSIKPNSKVSKGSVLLGNDIYKNITQKAQNTLDTIKKYKEAAIIVQDKLSNYRCRGIIEDITDDEMKAFIRFNENLKVIEKIIAEAKRMKVGSIALVNQITTISKQRIYDPKKDLDILSGIKLSDEQMLLIDEKIKKLYVN